MNQRSAGHLNRACGCTTGPPAFPHSHRSYLQMPRFAITFAFLASATFSSVLLCFSPLLRSRRREMDHVRTTSSAHQCRRQRPSPFEQGGSPSYLCFAPVRGATSKLHSRAAVFRHGPNKPPLPRGRASGHQAAKEGLWQAWATPRIQQPTAPDPPSVSSQLLSSTCRPSPPQTATTA